MKAHKNSIVWTLTALLFIHYVGSSLIYGLYAVDKELFVEMFCENKDNPELHCDGTCVLSKLSNYSNQQQDKPIVLAVFQIEISGYFHYDFDFTTVFEETLTQHQFFYKNNYRHTVIQENFRPPSLV